MYETEILYKIAPPGGGKTKWLAQRALKEHSEGNEIYLLIRDGQSQYGSIQFRRFMELFYANFNKIATIHPATLIETIPSGSVVLIDDLSTYDISLRDIINLKGRVKKIYITLEGIEQKEPCKCKTKCSSQESSNLSNLEDNYAQISIFDLDLAES